MNHAILKGRVAAAPIIDRYESGAVKGNVLVRTTRYVQQQPRWDIIPVTVWQPGEDLREAQPGQRISVVAQVRRDSYETEDGDRKWRNLEVVAERYWLGALPEAEAVAVGDDVEGSPAVAQAEDDPEPEKLVVDA